MHVSRLALDDFRSWRHVVVDFAPGVTILQGANGLGKTNLVEAIEVLSTGASHRTSSSLPLVARGCPAATIRANVVTDDGAGAGNDTGDSTGADETTYEVTIRAKGTNRARINGGPSLYMRDVVGQIPSVAFTPDDQRLVAGDPSSRRTFLNQACSLLVPGYQARLAEFTKIGKQRAALLKQLGRGGNAFGGFGDDSRGRVPDESSDNFSRFDPARDAALSGLEVWTGQFIEAGVELTRDRDRVLAQLAGPFTELYAMMAPDGGTASLAYEPSFDDVLLHPDDPDAAKAGISRHFQRIYAGEVSRGINLIGPQRDDFALRLDGVPAREFASNGEMWTMALALKMALFELVEARDGVKPIVILDDVFAQLDETRRAQILAFAAAQDQVLITVAAASDIPGAASLGSATIIDVAALKAGNGNDSHGQMTGSLDDLATMGELGAMALALAKKKDGNE
ncbi:DNA replication/repair protein RecF [Bifidobacterium choloepi]|uniref:DNA replication and repair protein RecF n=1 Tax=Bifidobacterium choloepi TaxID=2614131 RepID=A0A6I5N1G6_9BIFI|nr:AAA family ATPase [Bifidobacterium choloepi]NEG69985.1 AAA family ATPase [Bifidobacterium choloepi]